MIGRGWIFLCLICVPSFAQTSKPITKNDRNEPYLREDAPEEVKALWEDLQAKRQKRIESIEKAQTDDRALLSKTTDGRDRVPIQLRIKSREESLTEAKESKMPEPGEVNFSEVGSVGTLSANPKASVYLKISQVVDEHNAIITIETSTEGAVHTRKTRDGREEVTSVVGPRTTSSGPFWVKAETKGWLDGYPVPQALARCRYWKMVGTQKYDTVMGGTKTVAVLQPIPIDDYLVNPKQSSAAGKNVQKKH